LRPFVRKYRVQNEDPTEYANFEWLAGTMGELDRRAGASDFDEGMFAIQLDERIATYQDRLRLERALRQVTLADTD